MLAYLDTLIGTSAANWLIVAAAGLVFLVVSALLPNLLRRWRGKDGHPLF